MTTPLATLLVIWTKRMGINSKDSLLEYLRNAWLTPRAGRASSRKISIKSQVYQICAILGLISVAIEVWEYMKGKGSTNNTIPRYQLWWSQSKTLLQVSKLIAKVSSPMVKVGTLFKVAWDLVTGVIFSFLSTDGKVGIRSVGMGGLDWGMSEHLWIIIVQRNAKCPPGIANDGGTTGVDHSRAPQFQVWSIV